MNIQRMLTELAAERERIDRAIDALKGLVSMDRIVGAKRDSLRSPRKISAAARKRMSQAAKARWAAKKLASKSPRAGVKKTASAGQPRPRRSGMTAAGRKRLSEMMKKRWAERKKAGKATS